MTKTSQKSSVERTSVNLKGLENRNSVLSKGMYDIDKYEHLSVDKK